MKKVVVIGAGAAGLCCARHLSRFPDVFQVKVYEQGDQVGGTWQYNNPTPGQLPRDVRGTSTTIQNGNAQQLKVDHVVHSSIYKNLRTNIPKEIMMFPDFPIDEHLPSFPYHNHILTYFKRYSEHYNLNKFIEFKKTVEQVSPIPVQSTAVQDNAACTSGGCLGPGYIDSVKWKVTTSNLTTGERNSEECDFVIICNGHFSVPYVPEVKGLSSFPGRVIHSHLYREPEPFAGQAVLLVGVGPSGEDLIFDLAPHAKTVYLCNRHDPLVCKLPDNVEDLPGIAELKADGMVCFEDGRERHVDSIILATGYMYSYPFLTEDSGIKVENGKRVTPLYKHTFNAVHPSIAIMGVYFGVVPFPAFNLQAQWILSVWRGDKKLPDTQEMLRDIEHTYQDRLREGLPPHLAGHYLGNAQWELFRQFADLGGIEPLDPVIEKLLEESFLNREHQLMDYKNINYRLIGKDNFCVLKN